MEAETQPSLADYLTVSEAAQFLGVSPWTLRNWDKAGKLETLRHPINGYRIYRREQLEMLLKPEGFGGRRSNRPTPLFDWDAVGATDHFVQLYESDAFLAASVSRFLGAALGAGDGAILIATREHRRAVHRKLRAQGVKLSAARGQGQLISLDAAATLARFMNGDSPDPGRFREVIGPVVARAGAGRPRVRAFGEMVALLWAEGRHDAAIRLEELWNDLQRDYPFALCCGYPVQAFGGGGQEDLFARVCGCHSRTVPAESYATLADEGDRLQAIARLQQKAQALEAEIAHRRRVEESLRESQRRLHEFLATLAHELRNPLAPVRNALRIMRVAGDDRHAVEQARAVMERQLGQIVRLVDDLLDLSRITRGKVALKQERVSLAAVVAAAVETSRPLIEAAGHALSVSLPPGPLELDVDPTRLAQVLANLLNNAAKYTDAGGRITLAAERDGGQIVLRVRDTGIGIAPDMLPHIFDMFTQADRAGSRAQGGLGIGLTVVRTLVELHGGTITAHSDGPGKGSEFVVRLPLPGVEGGGWRVEGEATGNDFHSPSTLHPSPSTLRVLVVDDNEDAAQSLATLLRLLGQDVRTAHDGAQGLAEAERFRPDVALVDIGMPGMSGCELALHLRERPWGRAVTLIALTGWGQEEDRRRTRAAGFDHHLVKPVDLDALQELLRTPANGKMAD